MKKNSLSTLPFQELEERFKFVNNEVLRVNLAINLQYIVFLIKIDEEYDLLGGIAYSIYKNLILYTTSIIEGLLIHTFKVLLDKGEISPKAMKPTKIYKDIKKIYELDDSTTIIWGKQINGNEKFTRRTSFNDVIRASKKAKILDKNILDEIDELRDKRNKIHLAGLNSVDDYYSKNEVNAVFDLAYRFTSGIETILKESKNP